MKRRDLVLVALVAACPRLFLAWAVPLAAAQPDPNRAPDELQHVVAARGIAEGRPLRYPESGDPHASSLPSVYAPQAAALALSRAAGARGDRWSRYALLDERASGFPFARLGSVAAGVAGVLLVALAVFALCGSRAAGVLAGLAAALHPQLSFTGAYVNGDAATFAAGAFLALAVARWARAGEGEAGLAAVGLAGGLVLLGKPNGYAVLVPTAAWVLLRMRRIPLRALAAAAALAAIASLPVIAWNAWRTGGDPVGARALGEFVRANHVPDGRELHAVAGDFATMVAESSFAVLGNMDTKLGPPWYRAAALLLAAGLLAGLLSLRGAGAASRRAAAWLAASLAVAVLLLVRMSWFVDYQPQGRYLLLPAVLVQVAALLGPAALLRGPARWLFPAAGVAFLGAAEIAACALVLRFPFGP